MVLMMITSYASFCVVISSSILIYLKNELIAEALVSMFLKCRDSTSKEVVMWNLFFFRRTST